jgi:dihydroorotate dehydrogenase (NAD+) catalytic subunit
LKPVALAAVWTCASSCAIPVVGVGGVVCGRDALDLLDAGATAVQVGTALFRDPRSIARVRAELAELAGARQ